MWAPANDRVGNHPRSHVKRVAYSSVCRGSHQANTADTKKSWELSSRTRRKKKTQRWSITITFGEGGFNFHLIVFRSIIPTDEKSSCHSCNFLCNVMVNAGLPSFNSIYIIPFLVKEGIYNILSKQNTRKTQLFLQYYNGLTTKLCRIKVCLQGSYQHEKG